MSKREIDSVDRYNRYAEDWRFHHKLIWEIPSVAMAILAGILTISFSFLGPLPRVILLGLGTVLIFGLFLAVLKHRFGADLRTGFLEDLGQDIDTFPIRSGSDKGLGYLNKKREEEGRGEIWYGWLIRRSSEIYLICFMFVMVAVLLLLFGWAAWLLYLEGISLQKEEMEPFHFWNNLTVKHEDNTFQ
jgi:hypothetical protein